MRLKVVELLFWLRKHMRLRTL